MVFLPVVHLGLQGLLLQECKALAVLNFAVHGQYLFRRSPYWKTLHELF